MCLRLVATIPTMQNRACNAVYSPKTVLLWTTILTQNLLSPVHNTADCRTLKECIPPPTPSASDPLNFGCLN